MIWLARDARAEWITYASAPSLFARRGVELETVFTRAFELERVDPGAVLHARIQRAGDVTVNGTRFDLPEAASGDWKEARSIDVGAALRPGRNEIVARARSSFGPPALWLALDGEGLAVATDETWRASLAGATELPARLAATPMSDWSLREEGGDPLSGRFSARAPDTGGALARSAVRIGIGAAIAAALVLGLGALARRRGSAVATLSFPVAVLAGAAIWGPLFVHNRALSPALGFDNDTHGQYVQYILDEGRLPLADEGWEMYQPPLYYLVAAAVVEIGGYERVEPDAVPAVRWIGFVSGVLQIAFVVASLRLLFPDRPRLAVAGFVLAAFLPVQLYLEQYVTNEGLAAMLVSAAIFLALRILVRDDRSLRSHAVLGAVLGLAMLAKFSALIAVAAIVAVLVLRLLARGVGAIGVHARTVGALAVACAIVCGWHYARVTLRFGKPIVGNWDSESGFAWWQDPGYWTGGDFARFGASLAQPIYSAAHSVPDAIYSTLWGDGLVSGRAAHGPWPPWNYDAMAAGYLLAILPTLVLIAGFVAALVRLARDRRAEWLLLLSILGLTGFGVVVMTLEVPSYAQAKAFYGSLALVPMCAVGALGLEVLAGRSRVVRAVVLVALGAWATNAYVAFWSVDGAPAALLPAPRPDEEARAAFDRAVAEYSDGRSAEAFASASRAVELEPEHVQARSLLAAILFERGETAPAIAAARTALRLQPADAGLHTMIAEMYRTLGEHERALEHDAVARRAELPRR